MAGIRVGVPLGGAPDGFGSAPGPLEPEAIALVALRPQSEHRKKGPGSRR
ncbi:hypothetical protein [Pseudomonas sp. NFR16]|nr:hypothetical protein [Pseudomonas sp. NFR16]